MSSVPAVRTAAATLPSSASRDAPPHVQRELVQVVTVDALPTPAQCCREGERPDLLGLVTTGEDHLEVAALTLPCALADGEVELLPTGDARRQEQRDTGQQEQRQQRRCERQHRDRPGHDAEQPTEAGDQRLDDDLRLARSARLHALRLVVEGGVLVGAQLDRLADVEHPAPDHPRDQLAEDPLLQVGHRRRDGGRRGEACQQGDGEHGVAHAAGVADLQEGVEDPLHQEHLREQRE